MSFVRFTGSLLAALTAASVFAWVMWHGVQGEPREAPAAGGGSGFDGVLLAASDADQGYAAYADGRLVPIPGLEDTISVVDGAQPAAPIASAPASHSVIGWPQIIDVSPDGRFAYVAEVRGAPAKTVERLSDVYTGLPEGRVLTTLDVSDPTEPEVVSVFDAGTNLGAVSVSSKGDRLVLAADEGIVVVDLTEGVPSSSKAFAIDTDVGVAVARPGVCSVAFAPDGRHIAATISDREVRFYRLKTGADGAVLALSQVGDPVKAGETLTSGAFHPSGSYFFVPDVGWGENASATDFVFNGPGRLYAVRFDPEGAHYVSDAATVGRSPEGFAMSADGARLVTVDMNRTYLPNRFPFTLIPGGDVAALSLLSFDTETGGLKLLDRKGFVGALPEDAVFDRDADALAVAIYEKRGGPADEGYVAWWRIEDDRLVRTGLETPVVRGAHDLVLIP